MADHRPHIGLLENTSDLTVFTDGFLDEIRSKALVVERVKREDPLVYAAIEINDLPTLIGLYIFSTYFTGFLKKAGEAHYSKLERGLRRLSKELFRRERDTAIVGSGKIERPDEYSILFSVWTKAGDCKVKFAFRTQCSEKEYISTAGAILDFLSTYHAGNDPAQYRSIIDAINTNSQVMIAYNYESDSLYIV